MSEHTDIKIAVSGFIFGILSFFCGFMSLRRKRIIENIPTSTVRGMAMGLVEIIGKAKMTSHLRSPLTSKECLFYNYKIEHYEIGRNSGTWVTIAKGDSSFFPFYLDDGTGKITVLPRGAELLLPVDYEFETSIGKTIPSNLIEYMEANGIKYKGLFANLTLRFREWYICEGETVYVLGTAKKHHNAPYEHKRLLTERLRKLKSDSEKMAEVDLNKDGMISQEEWGLATSRIEQKLLQEKLQSITPDDHGDVAIGKGEMQKTFIISDHSQKELISKLSSESFLCIWGGAALTLVMLAYILFQLKHLIF